jgi:hypothetical protein
VWSALARATRHVLPPSVRRSLRARSARPTRDLLVTGCEPERMVRNAQGAGQTGSEERCMHSGLAGASPWRASREGLETGRAERRWRRGERSGAHAVGLRWARARGVRCERGWRWGERSGVRAVGLRWVRARGVCCRGVEMGRASGARSHGYQPAVRISSCSMLKQSTNSVVILTWCDGSAVLCLE